MKEEESIYLAFKIKLWWNAWKNYLSIYLWRKKKENTKKYKIPLLISKILWKTKSLSRSNITLKMEVSNVQNKNLQETKRRR